MGFKIRTVASRLLLILSAILTIIAVWVLFLSKYDSATRFNLSIIYILAEYLFYKLGNDLDQ